jgi:hypothetical protein
MAKRFQRLVRFLYAKGIDTTIAVNLWSTQHRFPDWTADRAVTVIHNQ